MKDHVIVFIGFLFVDSGHAAIILNGVEPSLYCYVVNMPTFISVANLVVTNSS